MNKTVIIIPSRLDAQRLPNKPLKLINNKEMILHVYEAAKKSNVGEVYVATPDEKIINVVEQSGGRAIQTSIIHNTGTDRIFELFEKSLNKMPGLVVNLQGDMPNIDPNAIKDLVFYMEKGNCDIGTLASKFKSDEELKDPNIVKVLVKENLSSGSYSKALDFFRTKIDKVDNLYHHVGIYAFTNKALLRYVSLKRSKLEIDRKLEQMRAMENNMSIHVGYITSPPLSVDTENDFNEVKKVMEND